MSAFYYMFRIGSVSIIPAYRFHRKTNILAFRYATPSVVARAIRCEAGGLMFQHCTIYVEKHLLFSIILGVRLSNKV